MAADEKRFTANGKEWVARFDFNAICEIEDRYDAPFLEFVAPFLGSLNVEDASDDAALVRAASLIKFTDLRTIFHQSLLACQPETTPADAGELISDMGLEAAMGVVVWAITSALPMGGEGAATANPPRRARRKG